MNGKDIAQSILGEANEELPQLVELEKSEAAEIYRDGQAVERAAWLQMGFAAACVEISYSDGALEEFARDMDVSLSTVKNQRRVYRRLLDLEKDTRLSILRGVANGMITYSHLLSANKLDDAQYADVASQALADNWSKRRTAEEVAQRTGQRGVAQTQQTEQDPTKLDVVDGEGGEYVETTGECPHCEGTGRVIRLKRRDVVRG